LGIDAQSREVRSTDRHRHATALALAATVVGTVTGTAVDKLTECGHHEVMAARDWRSVAEQTHDVRGVE
jgi:hypothetical protein